MNKIFKQSQAIIPTPLGDFNMIAFASEPHDPMPHFALENPTTNFSNPVNVRIHSECITGDLFGSGRCECGEQLKYSLKYISKNGGILIYLRQEGRGIGIINKLHAYTKQDEGYNTAEANKLLGFGYDERTYEPAIEILHKFGIHQIRLLTNNPEKVAAFKESGIFVIERISIEINPNETNHSYLKTKKEFFGHLLKLV